MTIRDAGGKRDGTRTVPADFSLASGSPAFEGAYPSVAPACWTADDGWNEDAHASSSHGLFVWHRYIDGQTLDSFTLETGRTGEVAPQMVEDLAERRAEGLEGSKERDILERLGLARDERLGGRSP